MIFGSYAQPKSFHPRVAGSGYENIAHVLGGVWHGLDEESTKNHDVVFACLAIPDTNPRPKPSCWGKLIGIQEAGFGTINTDWWVDYISTFGFDGFIAHTNELADFYKVFGKPVWKFNPAYCFDTARACATMPKEEKRVCINLVRHACPEGNITGTLRVMQELPDHQFHSYTGQTSLLKSIKERLGLSNWFIHEQVSWHDYLREASRCYVHLSMDNRMTWGRFQLDSLACGAVCVGCHSETQSMIFPDFMVSQTDISEAVKLIKENSSKLREVDFNTEVFSHDQLRDTLNMVASAF
jgi:hypothetical protein